MSGISSTKGSTNSATIRNTWLRCSHDLPVVHEICKKGPNKGRKFFGCPLWKVNEGCKFFKWDEGEVTEMMIESDLAAQLSLLKDENMSLAKKVAKQKLKIKTVEEELERLKKDLVDLKQNCAKRSEKFWVVFCFGIVVFICVYMCVGRLVGGGDEM